MKNKGRLLSSVLTVMLLMTVLVSGTFALFTDTVSIKNNTVTAGKVKIATVLTLKNATSYGTEDANPLIVTDNSAEFSNGGTVSAANGKIEIANITPGDGADFGLQIKNSSSVKAKFKIILSISNPELFDGIDFKFAKGLAEYNITGSNAETEWIDLNTTDTDVDFDISISMPISVGNEFQNKEFLFDLVIYAIQANGVDHVQLVSTLEQIQEAAEGANLVMTNNITSESPIALSKAFNLDMNGYALTAPSISFSDSIYNDKINFKNGMLRTRTTTKLRSNVSFVRNLAETKNNLIEINFPKAEVILNSVAFVVDDETSKVLIAPKTLYLYNVEIKTVAEKKIAFDVESQSKVVVMESKADTLINVPVSSTNVVIEDKRLTDSGEIRVKVDGENSNVTINNSGITKDVVVEGAGKDAVVENNKNNATMIINPGENVAEKMATAKENEVVFIRAGVYSDATPIVIEKSMTIFGEEGTVIHNTFKVKLMGIITVDDITGEATTQYRTVNFKNLTLRDTMATATVPMIDTDLGNVATGIKNPQSDSVDEHNIHSINILNCSFLKDYASTYLIKYSVKEKMNVENCTFKALNNVKVTYALHMEQGLNLAQTRVVGNKFYGNFNYGLIYFTWGVFENNLLDFKHDGQDIADSKYSGRALQIYAIKSGTLLQMDVSIKNNTFANMSVIAKLYNLNEVSVEAISFENNIVKGTMQTLFTYDASAGIFPGHQVFEDGENIIDANTTIYNTEKYMVVSKVKLSFDGNLTKGQMIFPGVTDKITTLTQMNLSDKEKRTGAYVVIDNDKYYLVSVVSASKSLFVKGDTQEYFVAKMGSGGAATNDTIKIDQDSLTTPIAPKENGTVEGVLHKCALVIIVDAYGNTIVNAEIQGEPSEDQSIITKSDDVNLYVGSYGTKNGIVITDEKDETDYTGQNKYVIKVVLNDSLLTLAVIKNLELFTGLNNVHITGNLKIINLTIGAENVTIDENVVVENLTTVAKTNLTTASKSITSVRIGNVHKFAQTKDSVIINKGYIASFTGLVSLTATNGQDGIIDTLILSHDFRNAMDYTFTNDGLIKNSISIRDKTVFVNNGTIGLAERAIPSALTGEASKIENASKVGGVIFLQYGSLKLQNTGMSFTNNGTVHIASAFQSNYGDFGHYYLKDSIVFFGVINSNSGPDAIISEFEFVNNGNFLGTTGFQNSLTTKIDITNTDKGVIHGVSLTHNSTLVNNGKMYNLDSTYFKSIRYALRVYGENVKVINNGLISSNFEENGTIPNDYLRYHYTILIGENADVAIDNTNGEINDVANNTVTSPAIRISGAGKMDITLSSSDTSTFKKDLGELNIIRK